MVPNGYALRAEFVRVQVEIGQNRRAEVAASKENDRRQDWLDHRETELYQDDSACPLMGLSEKMFVCVDYREWIWPQPPQVCLVLYRRGFVEAVRGPRDELQRVLPRLLTEHPVTEVMCTDVKTPAQAWREWDEQFTAEARQRLRSWGDARQDPLTRSRSFTVD